MARRFASFAEFYPFYLEEHSHRLCRRMHFTGDVLVLACLVIAAWSADWRWLAAMPVAGYGCAWAGHFFFEQNRPTTFSHPLLSLAGDWAMFMDMVRGRVSF